jgi:hypothetical protein
MRRRLEAIDLIVAVGVFATLIGGGLLFMAADGTLAAAMPQLFAGNATGNVMEATQFIQPALGQALVDNFVLERTGPREIASAASRLNQAASELRALEGNPFMERALREFGTAEADHKARVQFVLGREIANFTSRGIRSGALSATDPSGEYNRRMIEIAQATGKKMEKSFGSTREANLRLALMEASQWQARLMERAQQRFGSAMIQVAQLQDRYSETSAGLQQQLAAVMTADVKTDLLIDRLSQLAAAEPLGGKQSSLYIGPRSWPEIPVSFLLAMSATLVGIFCIGLLTPGRPELEQVEIVRPTAREKEFRKTA